MTCGTHTTANVTAAAFGFNPLLSGSFLKRHDSCECTICSLFRKKSPLRCPAGRARGTDTQIVILTLALSFFSFLFFFLVLIWRAGRPLCECAGHAGPGVPLCFTLETMEACCLILSPFRHHPSASSSRRKVIANTHSFFRVCVCVCTCVCVRAHVCVYIYIKRESNIYESIFFLFCDESY